MEDIVMQAENIKQYGQWMALPKNPPKRVIEQAKKLLRISARKTTLMLKKKGFIPEQPIVWVFHARYVYVDPETHKTKIIGTIGWKRFYVRKV